MPGAAVGRGPRRARAAPRPPGVPVATTLFKLSNPELMRDPKRRASWMITGGVAAFFAVYLSWTFYWEGREAAAARPTSGVGAGGPRRGGGGRPGAGRVVPVNVLMPVMAVYCSCTAVGNRLLPINTAVRLYSYGCTSRILLSTVCFLSLSWIIFY